MLKFVFVNAVTTRIYCFLRYSKIIVQQDFYFQIFNSQRAKNSSLPL